MPQVSGIILGLAYILGLFSTAVPWGGLGVFGLGAAAAIALPRYWRTGPRPRLWLTAGTVGLLAALYLQVQVPYPGANDISKFGVANQEQQITVQGKVESRPRPTRSQRRQFWLKATQLNQGTSEIQSATSQPVSGKLYVTVPPEQAKGLYPGQVVAVTGWLYKPKPASTPQGFDFQAYLKREGSFAGLSGRQITLVKLGPAWGWWRVRQRIIQAQGRWLGMPEGPLVSAMVLGNRAVDLPFNLRDQFTQVGLAHALAASGFQTSLILAVILALTRQLDVPKQLGFGAATLVTFACLSGFEPAIARAVLMGIAGLIALATQRQTRPLAVLLGTAVLLLLYQPLWIWDLGFQLSFLATLGLIVTVPPLTQRLDWLPPVIASLLAVPVAAFIWTLPLQLYTFGAVAPYSILANVVTTPLISVLTMGGFASALTGLIWPLIGSAFAWLLYWPTRLLIFFVEFFNQLPGNSVALGTIGLWQLIVLYGLLVSVSLWPRWQSRWWLAGAAALILVAVPVWRGKTAVFQVTVLATPKAPIMVIQEPGWTTLINSGDSLTARLTVLPFLQQQGINQIDWAIATETKLGSKSGWLDILEGLPIKNFSDVPQVEPDSADPPMLDALKKYQVSHVPLQIGQVVSVASTQINLLRSEPVTLKLNIGNLTWLFIKDLNTPGEEAGVITTGKILRPQVLWWSGKYLSNSLLSTLQPEVVIASSASIDLETIAQLQASNVQFLWTERDGAIQWTPNHSFEKTFHPINPIDGRLN